MPFGPLPRWVKNPLSAGSPGTSAAGRTSDENNMIVDVGAGESVVGGRLSVTGKWPWIPLCTISGCIENTAIVSTDCQIRQAETSPPG